ncbi:MAG: GtrA family protein [Lachnospiraceae bacterium]|jgi:putative flippase GtrA|nr:GtrA family protein [Lachnospiraceae bacterium]
MKMIDTFRQFLKFGMVGVTNTIVSYLLNMLTLFCFQYAGLFKRFDYLFAQFIAFVLSVAWSFFWNNKFVFKERDEEKRVWWKTLIKTYIAYSFTGIFLNSILLWIWVEVFQISKIVAPLLNIAFNVPINFLLNKYWAFKGEK